MLKWNTERAMDRLKIQAGLELPPPFYKLCIIMWREYIITISISDRNTSITSKIIIYTTSHIENKKKGEKARRRKE